MIPLAPVKDLLEGIEKIIKFTREGRLENAQNRKDFFHNFIEHSYEKMELVHKDYLTSFSMLLKMMKKEEKTNEEIVEWLKERKIQFSTERVRLDKIELEVFNNKFFNKSFSKDDEISKWTLQYLTDLVRYFDNGIYLQKMTWYNFLISSVESSLALQLKHPEAGPVGISGTGNAADIPKQVQNSIGIITSQFGFIAESYSQLRALCLR